jgi:DNA-binding MarR family transcriptional regulator
MMDEREFELVNIIGAELGVNQRDLSRHLDMSLGMTNMLIRRLISKGYIRIKQLNKKKVEYILTPKGFTEKMRKSVKYTLKTLHSITLIKKALAMILCPLYEGGSRKFYVLGYSDLAGLIEVVLAEQFKTGFQVVHVEELDERLADGVVLICRENVAADAMAGLRTINMIDEMSKDGALAYQVGLQEEDSLPFQKGVVS